MGDEDDQEDLSDEESAEYDWLVIDTALDVIIGFSEALGPQFGEAWKVFQKPVMKFASSQTNYERSGSVGVIAECTANMGDAITPYTAPLLKLLLHRLTDEDAETKSNAAYAIGLLVFHSTASDVYLPAYNDILRKLEPLLHTTHARTLDNASGCVSRMIMAHQDKVPVDEIMPVLVDLLPLKEDYEENAPIYDCITGLCKSPLIPAVVFLLVHIANIRPRPASKPDNPLAHTETHPHLRIRPVGPSRPARATYPSQDRRCRQVHCTEGSELNPE